MSFDPHSPENIATLAFLNAAVTSLYIEVTEGIIGRELTKDEQRLFVSDEAATRLDLLVTFGVKLTHDSLRDKLGVTDPDAECYAVRAEAKPCGQGIKHVHIRPIKMRVAYDENTVTPSHDQLN